MLGINIMKPDSFEQISSLTQTLEPYLGDKFISSMKNWFNNKKSPYPLEHWEIFISLCDGSPCGISGYYRHPNDQAGRFWVGWTGVAPKYRRLGVASQMMKHTINVIRGLGGKELWVYTEEDNLEAIRLYLHAGMNKQGRFAELGLEQSSSTETSIALMTPL